MIQQSVALRSCVRVLSYTMDSGNMQPEAAVGGAALELTGFFQAG